MGNGTACGTAYVGGDFLGTPPKWRAFQRGEAFRGKDLNAFGSARRNHAIHYILAIKLISVTIWTCIRVS